MFTTRSAVTASILAAAFALSAIPASAQTQAPSASACRQIVITGTNVGVLSGPFTNGYPLQVRRTGSVMTSCKLFRGNGSNSYGNKCGRSGYNYFEVNIRRTRDDIGFVYTKGYVPVTCARAR
ncbi:MULTISPECIES: hypothetical protein [unclassified Nonomuraea]|uniref:hypothetical protein n=1 Tax=unclassified Nonomuraea TaxID=2593643 RepID=UPI0033E761D6